jgi:hypothetical protein
VGEEESRMMMGFGLSGSGKGRAAPAVLGRLGLSWGLTTGAKWPRVISVGNGRYRGTRTLLTQSHAVGPSEVRLPSPPSTSNLTCNLAYTYSRLLALYSHLSSRIPSPPTSPPLSPRTATEPLSSRTPRPNPSPTENSTRGAMP